MLPRVLGFTSLMSDVAMMLSRIPFCVGRRRRQGEGRLGGGRMEEEGGRRLGEGGWAEEEDVAMSLSALLIDSTILIAIKNPTLKTRVAKSVQRNLFRILYHMNWHYK